MTILKPRDVLKWHDDGSTTVERHAIVDVRGRVIVADVVDDTWRQRLVDAFNAHEPNDDANDTVDALVQAEAFIRGFEDDELQEGIPDLLAGLRAAIVRERARPDLLAALVLAEKHIGSLCGDVAETDLPDWFADLATIRAAIAAAGGAIVNTGGDHTKSTFFEMLAIHRDSVEILEIVLDEREDVNGEEDEVLRDLIARIRAAIAKAEGRANG